jgi:SAM-dependent methyltransferase
MNNLNIVKSASCFLCGSINNKRIRQVQCGEKISYYFKCENCGLIFIYPKFSSEDVKKLYSVSLSDKPHMKRVFISDVINSVPRVSLIKYLGFNFQNKNCLDVGCATGGLLYLIQNKGAECYGIEPFKPFSTFTSKKIKGKSRIYNGFFEDFESNVKFDLITMFGVFQYFEEPELVLEKIKQMLNKNKKNCLIIGGVPNPINFENKKTPSKTYRSFLYNKSSLLKLLGKNGFEIKAIYYSKSDVNPDELLNKFNILSVLLKNTYSYFFNLNNIWNEEFKIVEDQNKEDIEYITIICTVK